MLTFEKIKRIAKDLQKLIYPQRQPLTGFKFKQGEDPPRAILTGDFNSWRELKADERWGEQDSHAWFYKKIFISADLAGKTVAVSVRTGYEGQWDAVNPQFLVFLNGAVKQGLDVNHTICILTDAAKGGEEFDFLLWGYTGTWNRQVGFTCELVVLDRQIEKFYYDLSVPMEVAALLPEEDLRRIKIIEYLDQAVRLLDLRKPHSGAFYNSLRKAGEYLEKEFYGKYCGPQEITAACIGHTHIDAAWLWRLFQSREKAARSFSTALTLMQEYPEFVFMSSQPQLYQFLKEDYPELYARVKTKVINNSWEPEGAMWLEADTNLTSGESLVRQILYGTRFFQKEFGVKSEILWLPDVFGYSAALPQILLKSGIKYFMTTKISWNQFNKIPYDTFFWRGIDGSEILTYFITTCDYNSKEFRTSYSGILAPCDVMGAWRRFQQKHLNNEVLICYGHGDGGGGATREMLENALRLKRGIPGCPQVKLKKAGAFFHELEDKLAKHKSKVPRWSGELYLELHRGTYTSMAKNKRYNRLAEITYNEAELISSIAMLYGQEYPYKQLTNGWNKILLNQFHDILPGSSIKEVYDDSWQDYQYILKTGEEVISASMAAIAKKINLKSPAIVVFNGTSYLRDDIVIIDEPVEMHKDQLAIYDGEEELILQKTKDKNNRPKLLFFAQKIPAKGYKTYYLKENATKTKSNTDFKNDLIVIPSLLENRFFRIRLNNKGEFTSIFDKKAGREVLLAGSRANVLQTFEDKPQQYDAWDIDPYYQDKMWEVDGIERIEVTEEGPVRGCLTVIKHYLDSKIEQKIYIYQNIPRIDVENYIDWCEKQVLLKVAFPVNINSDKATYDIQFGNLERPTHWNTSWDWAKFEVCAHKWADLSESGYGVSLLNDCKYGYDIKDNIMRLTLIKSGIDPNREADLGEHYFWYSLYPHTGCWRDGGTIPMAYNLNHPLRTIIMDKSAQDKKHSLPEAFSLVSADSSNVVIDTVKKAEDSDDIIIRLFEAYNRRGPVTLSFGPELAAATECDLMEKETAKLVPASGKKLLININPYEIKTLKIKFKK